MSIIDILLNRYKALIEALDSRGREQFFDSADFPWFERFEANWLGIRSEFDHLVDVKHGLPAFSDISERQRKINENSWKVFFIKMYGWKVRQSEPLCPLTCRLVAQVPEIRTAFFSILGPGARIKPHVGPFKGVLRYHLGLIVPENPESCRIRVGDQERSWREGEGFVFDDTYLHEAWNASETSRVILFIDFDRPLPAGLAIVNKTILKALKYLHPGVWEARRKNRMFMKNYAGT